MGIGKKINYSIGSQQKSHAYLILGKKEGEGTPNSIATRHAWGWILQALRAQQERMWLLPGSWSNSRKALNLKPKNKENLKVSIKD